MIKIEISGTAGIAVKDIKAKTKTLPKAVAKATLFIERQHKIRFAKQVDPDNVPWAALKPSTLRTKKTNAILRETSNLANSANSITVGLKGRVFFTAGYGIYHQKGTSKMAQRKILGIGEADRVKVQKIISIHLGLG